MKQDFTALLGRIEPTKSWTNHRSGPTPIGNDHVAAAAENEYLVGLVRQFAENLLEFRFIIDIDEAFCGTTQADGGQLRKGNVRTLMHATVVECRGCLGQVLGKIVFV